MKEFSQNSDKDVAELSTSFETSITTIQLKVQQLKLSIDKCPAVRNVCVSSYYCFNLVFSKNNQTLQHFRLIQQFLSKAMANQMSIFKSSLKQHEKHLQERNKRMEKYGRTSALSSSSVFDNKTTIKQAADQYAMFQSSSSSSSLTHRKVSSQPPANVKAEFYSHQQFSEGKSQQMLKKDDHRLRQAEKAEASIKQIGQLFTQMATLVAEQSEVILRIEDDVEAGIAHTIEGHKHLETVYEITKGNRSLIIKIFLLLIFFVFLFLVWT
jgi:syntaxin 5